MRIIYYAIIVSVLFSCSKNSNLPPDSPGKIGNEVLTSADLILWIFKPLFDHLPDSLKADTIKAFINRKLIQKEVESSGIINDISLIKKLRKWERDKLVSMQWKREIIDNILSDERLNTLFQEMQFERQISIITIKYGDEDRRTEEQAKKRIEEIYQKSHSTPFFELVNKYAEDSESLKNGGIYGWVTKHIIGRKNVIMDSVIWRIKVGDVCKPVHTEKRFVIVKVIDERETYWASVDKDLESLKPFAFQLWREEFSERDKAYIKKLHDKFNFSLNPQGIEEFINKYKKEKERSGIPPLEVVKNISGMESLGIFMDIDMNKEWLLNRASESDNIHHATFTNREYLENYLNSIIRIELVCEQARELDYNKEEGYKNHLKKYKLDLYYSHYLNNYVYNKIEPGEEEIKSYYDKHNNLFKTEPMVRIALIEVSQEKKANEIYKHLQSGESFENMARQFNEKRYFTYDYGDIPAFTEKEYKSIGNVAFKMKLNEIYAPKRYKSGFIIIKLLEIIPSQTKFLSEVKGNIKRTLVNSVKKEAREQVIQTLHKKYDVVINKSFIDSYNLPKSTVFIDFGSDISILK